MKVVINAAKPLNDEVAVVLGNEVSALKNDSKYRTFKKALIMKFVIIAFAIAIISFCYYKMSTDFIMGNTYGYISILVLLFVHLNFSISGLFHENSKILGQISKLDSVRKAIIDDDYGKNFGVKALWDCNKSFKFLECCLHGHICSCRIFLGQGIIKYTYVYDNGIGFDVVPINDVHFEDSVSDISISTCGVTTSVILKNTECADKEYKKVKVVN